MHDARATVFAKQDARSMWLKFLLLNLMKASLQMFPVTMLPAKEDSLRRC